MASRTVLDIKNPIFHSKRFSCLVLWLFREYGCTVQFEDTLCQSPEFYLIQSEIFYDKKKVDDLLTHYNTMPLPTQPIPLGQKSLCLNDTTGCRLESQTFGTEILQIDHTH
jgi:hypothetical protein